MTGYLQASEQLIDARLTYRATDVNVLSEERKFLQNYEILVTPTIKPTESADPGSGRIFINFDWYADASRRFRRNRGLEDIRGGSGRGRRGCGYGAIDATQGTGRIQGDRGVGVGIDDHFFRHAQPD
jgi:hypothetical protein